MTIEKGEEIQVCYRAEEEFFYSSRESRRQQILKHGVFLCQCPECSLEGEDLEENEHLRTKLRETLAKQGEGDSRRTLKLAQKATNLVQKLNLRALYMSKMLQAYILAIMAKRTGISCENDPDVFKEEALKYAKILGDNYLYFYNTTLKTLPLHPFLHCD